jgi:hypothetical protein
MNLRIGISLAICSLLTPFCPFVFAEDGSKEGMVQTTTHDAVELKEGDANESTGVAPTKWPDAALFKLPSSRFGVETWWHWINGNVSKTGISEDLNAMHDQGIIRANMVAVSTGQEGPVNPLLSDVWLDHWRYAVSEADRTGIQIATDLGPGWSETGGPWIKPENSMKRVVWADKIVEGGSLVDVDLPPLPSLLGWSRDIAVLAWPTDRVPSSMAGCSINSQGQEVDASALSDGNPNTGINSDDPTKWHLDFTFAQPRTCDRLHLSVRWKAFGAPELKLHVRVSADGKPVTETYLDGQRFSGALIIPIPSTTATRFSLDLDWASQPEPWQTFRQVQLTEAELLQEGESPSGQYELLNLAQESDDMVGAGPAVWAPGPSHPIPVSQIIDLTSQTADGHLKWQAPPGRWRIVRMGFTTTGKKSSVPQKGGDGLETDKMSVAATDLHFHSYMQRLIDAIPADQRHVFDAALLDSWEVGCQNWTDDFTAEFERRRGYAITPYLAVLAGDVVGSRDETERFLNDFRQTIGELMAERFYGRNVQLLHEQNMKLRAEIPDGSIPCLDSFAAARLIDEPMDEFHSDKEDGSLEVPSAGPPRHSTVPEMAYVAGKPIVGAEAFTSSGSDYRRTPGDYGYLGDHALNWGFNSFQLHSFVHQPSDIPPGWTLGRHGQPFNRLNTWWPMIGDWLREISRAQYLCQTSTPVYDVLVYAGDITPRPRANLSSLPDEVRPLHIDAVALNRLQVHNGLLTLRDGDLYPALIVSSTRLRAETVEAITRLLREGATIFMDRPGSAPGWSDHVSQDSRIQTEADAVWGKVDPTPGTARVVGQGKLYAVGDLSRLFVDTGYRPACSATPEGSGTPLQIQHRRAGDAELFGLFNPGEKATTYACVIPHAGHRVPEIANPVDGSCLSPADWHLDGDSLSFSLAVEGRRTVYVILSNQAAQASPAAAPVTMPAGVFAITSPFTATFNNLPGLAPQPWQLPASWTESNDPQIRNYSGIVTYRTEFSLPTDFPVGDQVILDLGRVSRVARVTLNGKPVGTLWRAPWNLEVGPFLKSGTNALQIEVANTWENRLLADESLPPSNRSTFTSWNPKKWIKPPTAPEASGLLGDIQLRTVVGK